MKRWPESLATARQTIVDSPPRTSGDTLMKRPPLPGKRFKVTVVERKSRRWRFTLRIRDGLTDVIRRETLTGLKPSERDRAHVLATERERFLNGLGESATTWRTWQDACDVLLAHVQGRRRAATVRMYRLTLERFRHYAESPAARQTGPTLYLQVLSAPAVAQDYIGWRLARVDGHGRKLQGGATLNKDLRIFKAAWNFWLDRGFIAGNPWLKIARQPETRRLHVRLTAAQAARLLAESGGDTFNAKFRAALHLALDTGMRIGELSHVTWSHIDLEDRCVHIAREPCGWEPKDYEQGRLAFGPDAAELLREIHHAGIGDLTRQGKPALTGDEARELLAGQPVFGKHDSPGEDLWEREFRADLKRCCARAGVPIITAHDLRRTVARLANAAGASPEDLRTMLRHSAFATTLTYIGDDQRDGSRRAFEALSRGRKQTESSMCAPRCPHTSEAEAVPDDNAEL